MTGLISDLLDYILMYLLGFFQSITDTVFALFGDFFKTIYDYLVQFFTFSSFETVGQEFFSTILDRSQSDIFSINIVYWIVGLMLCIFVFKHFVLPLVVSLVDDIVDLFTPS